MSGEAKHLRIRSASREDMAAVANMAAEFHAHLAAKDNSDPTYDIEGTRAKLVMSGFGDRQLFSGLIAESAGEPIGYAIYNIGFWPDTMEGMVLLTDIYVREPWRDRGVGKQIMKHLATVGQQNSCAIVMWSVWPENEEAIRFYKKLGAETVDDELLMKLPI